MRVLFLPDYSAANAYQRALAAGLRDLGVEVRADPTRARRVAPVLEALRGGGGRPDVIHLHWTEPYIARGPHVSALKAKRTLMELRLARRAGMRIVWTAHDLFRHDRAEDPAERAFMRALFDLADAVIVHCASAADALLIALGVEPTARSVEPTARSVKRHGARASSPRRAASMSGRAPRSASSPTATIAAPTRTPSRVRRRASAWACRPRPGSWPSPAGCGRTRV